MDNPVHINIYIYVQMVDMEGSNLINRGIHFSSAIQMGIFMGCPSTKTSASFMETIMNLPAGKLTLLLKMAESKQ